MSHLFLRFELLKNSIRAVVERRTLSDLSTLEDVGQIRLSESRRVLSDSLGPQSR